MTMKRKNIVVTGGTDGIGKVTAMALAQAGARVTIMGRNASKCAAVVRELEVLGNGTGADHVVCDLSSMRSIEEAAEVLKGRMNSLDVLVNNAGAMFQQRSLSADGMEMTFALNHMGYFALTTRLIDLLRAAPQGRIVNVASAAHLGARLNLEDLQNDKRYSGWIAYGQSKLANVYFTYELARRLQGSGVTANCLHPGFVDSAFGNNNGGWLRVAIGLAKRTMAISQTDGAKTSIHLAGAPEVAKANGKYFDKCAEVKSSAISYDVDMAKGLWKRSEELSSLTFK